MNLKIKELESIRSRIGSCFQTANHEFTADVVTRQLAEFLRVEYRHSTVTHHEMQEIILGHLYRAGCGSKLYESAKPAIDFFSEKMDERNQ